MKKYVIEIDKSCEATDAMLKRIEELVAEFLKSDRPVGVLSPGVTLKIFDTEDGVTPDVEVLVNAPAETLL